MKIVLRWPFDGHYPVTFPFGAKPQNPVIEQKFREWGIVGHNGIDFGMSEGTKIKACDSGHIIVASKLADFGISVIISHKWGESLCAHLSKVLVGRNKKVKAGDIIGLSGQTGTASGAHLHFGIKPKNPNPNNGYAGFIDPSPYFQKWEKN